MTQKIEFVDNLTSWEALKYIAKLWWVITRNTGKAINKFVHLFPWAVIITTIIISFIVSFVQISKARAERDKCDHILVKTQQQLQNYKIMYESNSYHHE